MAILNKLTPQKFKTFVEQIMALNIETPERLGGVVDRICEKVLPLRSLRRNTRMSIPLYSEFELAIIDGIGMQGAHVMIPFRPVT